MAPEPSSGPESKPLTILRAALVVLVVLDVLEEDVVFVVRLSHPPRYFTDTAAGSVLSSAENPVEMLGRRLVLPTLVMSATGLDLAVSNSSLVDSAVSDVFEDNEECERLVVVVVVGAILRLAIAAAAAVASS
jgi:hypothetical protein